MADSFEHTGLSPVLCAMAAKAGLTQPTPIQDAAIPAILQGRDILATAPTGTGKTAAYALPLIQTLLQTRKARMVLVLLPTRDLVLQTAKVFLHCMGVATGRGKATSQPPVPVVPIIGGTDRTEQTQALVDATSDLTRPCTQILIATPGRLLDLVMAGQCSLDDCASLVLDEGDRLLSAEFLDETSALLDHLPQPRQTLVFSATRPDAQASLLASLLYKPQEITVEREPLKRGPIRQGALFMEDTQKAAFLKTFFSRAPKTRSIVFVRTKAEADQLAATLRKAGFAAAPLHADLTQERRTSTLASFGAGRLFILVATDVAARGLDIAAVAQVINYDVPEQPETYLHRIGRTGRAGQKGSALTLCAAAERKRLRQVEVGAGVKLRILSPEQALSTEQDTSKSRRTR